jgi:hypothetical protein
MRRVVSRAAGIIVLLAVLLAPAAPVCAGGDLTMFGAHAAYYDEFRKGAIGLNARTSFGTSPLTVGFKGDYLFRPRRVTWVFEADVQYELELWSRGLGWAGGGAGVLRDDIDGPLRADIDPIVSGFVGIGYKPGAPAPVHGNPADLARDRPLGVLRGVALLMAFL